MPETIRRVRPKARKTHICDWCALRIRKGEQYIKDTVVFDDRIYTWVSHFECDDETARLNECGGLDNQDDGWPRYALVSYVESEYLSEEWNLFYEQNKEEE